MQMCLQNIYRCFAISFTPILQLIQTRRIFVPDQGKLEKTHNNSDVIVLSTNHFENEHKEGSFIYILSF